MSHGRGWHVVNILRKWRHEFDSRPITKSNVIFCTLFLFTFCFVLLVYLTENRKLVSKGWQWWKMHSAWWQTVPHGCGIDVMSSTKPNPRQSLRRTIPPWSYHSHGQNAQKILFRCVVFDMRGGDRFMPMSQYFVLLTRQRNEKIIRARF